MLRTVGEVAREAGVSVRTLHHWEALGLLVPSQRSASGYRLYDEADLARLQRVLAHRELGLGLEQVRALLDREAEPLELLRRQQTLLADEIARLQLLQAAVGQAVEVRRMGIELEPHEVREVFGDADPSEHAAEARERWGETEVYAQSQARTSAFSKQDWLRVRAEGEDVERRFALALSQGVPAGALGELVAEHRAWIGRFYDCDAEMHRSLARMYVEDERFRAHYDAVAPGLAQYVHDAITA